MLHRHAAHAEAVARIGWCVSERRIGVVIGEVGAGKTVATRAALADLDGSRHIVIYVSDPTVGVRGILHHIVSALGRTPSFYKATLVLHAADALAIEQAERGRTPILVVDEAHLLAHDQLESIRMLTNHDMDAGSTLACLLIGQPTLRRRIKLGALAALDQRIGLRYTMPGMDTTETGTYLRHHLGLAGRSDAVFSDNAVAIIKQASRVYARAVNNIALQALIAAFVENKTASTMPRLAPRSPRSTRTETRGHHQATEPPTMQGRRLRAHRSPSALEAVGGDATLPRDGGIPTDDTGHTSVDADEVPGRTHPLPPRGDRFTQRND